MPTLRGRTYYVKRRLPGVGQVYRTLDTDRKGIARQRENMLKNLADRGRVDLLRAWLAGRVSLAELMDARDTNATGELTEKLQREDVPLAQAIDAAMRHKAPDVKEETRKRWETSAEHFRRFATATLGPDVTAGQALVRDHIQTFKGHRLEAGAARETVNNDLQGVSVVVTHALDKGWIVKRPKVKRFKTRIRIRYVERGELAAYMAALRRPFRPLFQLLIGTGMRLGEAEALTVRTVKFGEDGTRALIEDAKTESGVRAVFVPDWAAATLRDHIEDHGLPGPDRLFSFPRRTTQAEHRRACKIAGITKYTIHDHRHTFAVTHARVGMPLDKIQRQLGHKKIEMTMRYATFHPAYNDVGTYFEQAGQLLGLAPEPASVGNRPGNIPQEAVEKVEA